MGTLLRKFRKMRYIIPPSESYFGYSQDVVCSVNNQNYYLQSHVCAITALKF